MELFFKKSIIEASKSIFGVNYKCVFLSHLVTTGKAVFNERGELVCIRPFPSMPTHFLNDKDGVRYHKAYFR